MVFWSRNAFFSSCIQGRRAKIIDAESTTASYEGTYPELGHKIMLKGGKHRLEKKNDEYLYRTDENYMSIGW